MKRKNLLLLLVLLTSSALQFVNAQTEENKTAISISIGKNEYNGDLGNGLFNFNQTHLFGGLTLATFISPSFDLGVEGNYGAYGYENSLNKFLGYKYDGFMFLNYKFNNGYIMKQESKLSPFITAGIGLAGYVRSGNNTMINTFPLDLIVPVGVGLKYQISELIAVQYKFLYDFTNHDEHDLIRKTGRNDHFAEHLLSLNFTLGAAKDEDKDGVSDKYDNCLGTPAGVKVDSHGCPIDTDGDGVADYLDKCPDVPGLAKFQGCPDTDGDGVQDSEDKCPTVPGLAKFQGCPDTDGDGIQDSEDKCPTVPGLAKFQGCPDSDNDGVQDSMDKCPNTPAGVKVDANGCPIDTDGDGVPDYLDKCPTVPGIAANKGCPEVKAETKKIFQQALTGIQFESGKDVIKKSSDKILDQVVKVMKENPTYNLEINGHTDSQGDDAKNLDLSQRRANAVKAYLVNKGVAAEKLTAKGFGETMPIADNATAAGRAKNRRVEFKVNF